MRLRNITGSEEIIAASAFVVKNPEEYRGRWNERFQNSREIHIEVGMGKGRFLMELAGKNSEVNYVGIERYASVLLRAVQKLQGEEPENLCFLCMDAARIGDVFAQGEVGRVYLNFSDPWPKERHAKRRLPSRQFLERFAGILKKGGAIEFKTDNRALFDFALEEIGPAGFQLLQSTYDLHEDPVWSAENILTEYEEKFVSAGNPICKYIITR